MTVQQLSTYLSVPVATIYDWRVDGRGPRGVRVGRRVMFLISDVDEWVRARREGGEL